MLDKMQHTAAKIFKNITGTAKCLFFNRKHRAENLFRQQNIWWN